MCVRVRVNTLRRYRSVEYALSQFIGNSKCRYPSMMPEISCKFEPGVDKSRKHTLSLEATGDRSFEVHVVSIGSSKCDALLENN